MELPADFLSLGRGSVTRFLTCLQCTMYNDTFNAPVDISPLYTGVGLRGFPFFQIFKALFILQIPCLCVFANCSFK